MRNMRDEIIEKLKSFDFHDGEILEVRLDGQDAVMLFKNWQEDIFKITFRDVVGFQALERRCGVGEGVRDFCGDQYGTVLQSKANCATGVLVVGF